jgi:hypothetical protein
MICCFRNFEEIEMVTFKQCKFLFFSLIFFISFNCYSTEAERYIVNLKSWQKKYCTNSHLGSLAEPIKETVGGILRTNPGRIDFKRFVLSNDECILTLYSDKGPITCQILFDQSGSGSLDPCPFTEELSAAQAAYRFSIIAFNWAVLNAKPQPGYVDPFIGTGRGGK